MKTQKQIEKEMVSTRKRLKKLVSQMVLDGEEMDEVITITTLDSKISALEWVLE